MAGISPMRITYRKFREEVWQRCSGGRKRDMGWNAPAPNPIQTLRERLETIRSYVAWHVCDLIRDYPDSEPHIRRLLRIPSSFPLIADRWSIFFQCLRFLLPDQVNLWYTRAKLDCVGTYEGRKYVFDEFLGRSLSGRDSYEERLDFALRRLRRVKHMQEYEQIRHLGVPELQACVRIGLCDPIAIRRALPISVTRLPGALLCVLVDEEVVQVADDIAWTVEGERDDFGLARIDEVEPQQVRETIRQLLFKGVPRGQVAKLFRRSFLRLDPKLLGKNLELLAAAGVKDIAGVLEAIDDCLWTTPQERWQFVLEIIGARTIEEISQFQPLLNAPQPVSKDIVQCLIQLGAGIPGLAACQAMLISLKANDVATALLALQILASPPHSLSIEQLGQSSAYLKNGYDVTAFLSVLTQFGYGNADGVLAFQVCYTTLAPRALASWLSILTQCAPSTTSQLAADWVMLARKGDYQDSFKYLMAAIDLVGVDALQQSMKLAALGVPLLRYLVEDRRLGSLKSLRDWYYNDATGIEGYHSWGTFDALDKQLLDDAFDRKSFNLLTGNQVCISEAIDDHVKPLLGPFPLDADEATRDAYHAGKQAAIRNEREMLESILPSVLHETGGVALSTLIEAAWVSPAELEVVLQRLSPVLSELLSGRGPTHATLTKLETDAVALIYRTSVETVQSFWPRVIGRERYLDRFSLRSSYSMTWHSMRWRLKKPLNRSSLRALQHAVEFADRFSKHNFRDMYAACKNLSPKPLKDAAADIWSLAHHLGVLLAAAKGDSNVDQWVYHGFKSVLEIDEESLTGRQRVMELLAFFEVVLADALTDRLESFSKRFNLEDAAMLAARLGEPANGPSESGSDWLMRALCSTRDKVLCVGASWARRDFHKFEKENDASKNAASLSAIVSTYPAAFFAKEAAKLCTRHNTAMWCEERQAHLLVFDANVRRIAGMALLYIEVLPALHPTRPSLVIRAINPMGEMAAGYSPKSIVDAFFDVAIEIAKDSDCACVAFPSPAGMHLLSNLPVIEDDIKNRFIKPSKRHWAAKPATRDTRDAQSWRRNPLQVDTSFHAYERGQTEVDHLYVIWAESLEPVTDKASVQQIAHA